MKKNAIVSIFALTIFGVPAGAQAVEGETPSLHKNPVPANFANAENPVPADNPPNIIVFLVDDMGWNETSVNFAGTEKNALNKRYRTPNVERLAAMGVKFSNAHAAAVSSPSRCSLISGMNPARHRVTNWTGRGNTNARGGRLELPEWNWNGVVPAEVKNLATNVTDFNENRENSSKTSVKSVANFNQNHSTPITPLPALLRSRGYRTIHVGKGNFGAFGAAGENPSVFGFDVNIAGGANGAPASYLAENEFGSGAYHVAGLEKYYAAGTFLSEALTLEAVAEMQKSLAENRPFFLYLSHYAIHTPYERDARFAANYGNEIDAQLGEKLSPEEINHAALIEGVDKSLGDVLDFLESVPAAAKNTILIFMSDNGGQALWPRQGRLNRDQNFPLRAGKGSAYLGGVREPMIVAWPGVAAAGTTNKNPVIIEDFFPTILEMAGTQNVETVQEIDGKSFVDLLKNPAISRERDLIWHYPNRWGESADSREGYGAYSAILSGNFHLIYFWESQELRLYDVERDLGEQQNLANDERFAGTLRELAGTLSAELRRMNAQRPRFSGTHELVPWPDGGKNNF